MSIRTHHHSPGHALRAALAILVVVTAPLWPLREFAFGAALVALLVLAADQPIE